MEVRDVFRRMDADHLACFGTYCQHAMLGSVCECVAQRVAQSRQSAYPFRHVIVFSYDVYGLKPEHICSYLEELQAEGLTAEFRMCLHRFADLTGTLFRKENTYTYTPKGQVMEFVLGNGGTQYGPHSPTQWVWVDHDPVAGARALGRLAWVTFREYGPDREVTCFRFAVLPGGPPLRSPPADSLPLSDTIVEHLVSRLRYAPVETHAYKLATSIASKIVQGKNSEFPCNTPPSLCDSLVEAYVTVATARAADSSSRIMHAVEKTFSVAHAANQVAELWFLGFRMLVVALILACFTLCALAWSTYHRFALSGVRELGLLPTLTMGAGSLLLYLIVLYRTKYSMNLRSTWLSVAICLLLLFGGVCATPVPPEDGVITQKDARRCFLTYHSNWRTAELDPSAKISYETELHRDGVNPHFFGMCTAMSRPTFSANCQCNEVTSLYTRALAQRPGSSLEYWERATACGAATMEALAAAMGETWKEGRQGLQSWLSKPRLSAKKKAALTEAHDQVVQFGLDAKDYVRNVFVKIEPVSKTIAGIFEDYDPRTIMGMSDKLQSTLGPWFTAISTKTKDVFGTIYSPIFYAIGADGKQIGRWFSYWRSILGGHAARVGDADASRFDKNLERVIFTSRADVLRRRGAPEHVVRAYLRKIKKIGYTRHGVSFEVDGTRASGDSDTSWDNTMIDIDFWIYTFSNLSLVPGADYAVAAAGDDVVFIFHPRVDLDKVAAYVSSHGAGSGIVWKTQFQRRLCDLTFLSGIFLPRAGQPDEFVLVPRPGRLLSRLGWSRIPVKDTVSHTRAIALGLRDATTTVPISGVLIDKMLALTTTAIPDAQLLKEFKKDQPFALRFDGAVEFGVEATEQLLDRYDISYATLLDIEGAIEDVEELPHVFDNAAMEHIVERDIM
jgi:hypothetical protein